GRGGIVGLALVRAPVAVVVEPVARLARRHAGRRSAADHSIPARVADVHAVAPARPETVEAARAEQRIALVHRAVAVVVEPVAERFGLLEGRGIGALPASRAAADRDRPAAHPVGIAEVARAHEPLVDETVAVVVAPVAD